MLRFKHYLQEKASVKPVFNPLKNTDLRKDENRVLNFLKKIEEGHTFATVKKGEVLIPKSEYESVEKWMRADMGKFPLPGTKLEVKTNKGVLVVPGDFLKTGDFGGKGQGSGVSAETAALNFFNDNLNKLLAKENVSHIQLRINGRVVKCAQMVKTTGTYAGRDPKSDFSIVDETGQPVAYISHKAGSSARDYQQYGGVSYNIYSNNKFIAKFMDDVNKIRPGGLQSGDSFYREISYTNRDGALLINQSIYGPEYGKAPGISNVDEFHLGNMHLKPAGKGVYTLSSSHQGQNGDKLIGDYKAVLFIRFQARRGDARAAGKVVKNARVGVFPLAKISRTTQKI